MSMLSSLNTSKDGMQNYAYYGDQRLSSYTLIEMYRTSPVTRKVVNSLVDDSIRKGIEFDHEISDKILEKLEGLKLFSFLERAAKTARQTGKGLAFFHINDGNFPEIPVNHKRIKDVIPAYVLGKNAVSTMSADMDGNPKDWEEGETIEFYKISGANKIYQIWHKSRVLEFDGVYAGEDALNSNNGSYESVIDIARKGILLYEVFCDSTGNLSDRAIQEVLQIEGLGEKIKSNRQGVFNYLQTMLMSKSVLNKLVIDKKDTFSFNSASFQGYKDLGAIIKEFLSLITGIPIPKLFGTSPSASIGSQSGGYEEKLWINDVETYQQNQLRPAINKFLTWIKPLLQIPETEVLLFTFPSLYPIDPKTDAEIREIQSRTDTNYINGKVTRPEEIALSRFKGKWNMNTQINIEEREKALLVPADQQQDNIQDNNNDQNNPIPEKAASQSGTDAGNNK